MFSPHPYNEMIARQRQIAAQAQLPNELQASERRPRRRFTSRGRLAVALAVAASVGSGCAAIAAAPRHTPAATTHESSTGASAQVLHVGASSRSFVRRIRALEARGYIEVACKIDGDLMFNPRTHRYATVRA
jgi:hypothetical protein